MMQLLKGAEYLGIEIPQDKQPDAVLIKETSLIKDIGQNLPAAIHKAIKNLWADPVIQEALNRRNEFYLIDWAKYFIESIDRIADHSFTPTTQDILNIRTETTGVTELTYNINNMELRVIDVGGDKIQRRKWIHLFDNVNAFLFIVAISEYDQVIRGEESTKTVG